MSEITVTSANFDEIVAGSEVPVLVDFWAEWCGPCRMLSPVIAEIAEERKDIKVGKVNVDEEPALAMKFGIQAIPTVILFRDGKAAAKSMGYRPKAELLKMLD
jgi:thioredoxin 1